MLRTTLDNLGRLWCRLMHDGVMYGGGSTYECRDCLRRYNVPWGAQNLRAHAPAFRHEPVARPAKAPLAA